MGGLRVRRRVGTIGATNRRHAMHMRQTYTQKPKLPERPHTTQVDKSSAERKPTPRRPSTGKQRAKQRPSGVGRRRLSTGLYASSPRIDPSERPSTRSTHESPGREKETSNSSKSRRIAEEAEREKRVLAVLSTLKRKIDLQKSRRNTLMSMFRRFDADSSGTITGEEFSQTLCTYLNGQNIAFDRSDCQYLVSKMDKNDDGLVDLPEFMSALQDDPVGLFGLKTGPETQEEERHSLPAVEKHVTFGCILEEIGKGGASGIKPVQPIVNKSTAHSWFFPPKLPDGI